MSYNFDYVDPWAKEELRQQTLFKRQEGDILKLKYVKNATILPMQFNTDCILGGVVDNEDYFISNTGFHVGKEGYYPFPKGKVICHHRQAFYLGYFNGTWGHCFTDNLKLLWPFVDDLSKHITDNSELDLVYICDKNFELSKSFQELLQLLGINVDRLKPIENITRYDMLYVPDACFYTKGSEERYYTKEYVKLINTITTGIQSVNVDKIYLTRTALKHGKDQGERDIECVFKRLGYKIISPEKLDFRTQLAYIKGCKTMATTEGSISHNAVFMSKGANLEIVRKVPFVNEYQIALNEINNLHVTYIDAHLSVFARKDALAAGPFFIYVNDNLIRFSGIKGLSNTFSLGKFKRYVNSCIMLPHLEQRILLSSYYYEKASCEIERKKTEMKDMLNKIPFLSSNIRQKILLWGKKILS